jgi:hypothetical protein
MPTLGAQPVDLFCVRVEDYLQLTGTRLPLWLPPASRSDINGDTSFDCGCIGDDLTKFLDFEFELGKPRASEAFIKPVPDIDYPHGHAPES